jgi:hypothetical protein
MGGAEVVLKNVIRHSGLCDAAAHIGFEVFLVEIPQILQKRKVMGQEY